MRTVLAALFVLMPGWAQAACDPVTHEGRGYAVCTVTADQDLRLFHSGEDGVYGSFAAINQALDAQGLMLGFAMNAGMYAPDRAPLGL